MFRRTRHEPTPEERTQYGLEVASSLEALGLDKESTLVMGGSALALYGIRRASDLDVMVPGSIYRELAARLATPNNIRLRHKLHTVQPFLETAPLTAPSGILHIDITQPTDFDNKNTPVMEEHFRQGLDTYDRAHGYTRIPLDYLVAHKQSTNRRKDRRDIEAVKAYLAQQEKDRD